MNLTSEMKKRLVERINFQKKVELILRVYPKMELIITNGKSSDGFNLRSLNLSLLKKPNVSTNVIPR